MDGTYYTMAVWQVREGQQGEFLRVWREELGPAFAAIDPGAQGTLLQSLEDPRRYVSFGPWESPERMQAARGDPVARAILQRLIALCDEAMPGAYRVVLTAP